MSRTLTASVWTLTLNLHGLTTETDRENLHQEIQGCEQREPFLPFFWQYRGAVLTVKTQGDVGLLTEIAEWALDNLSPTPKGFSVENTMTTPLVPEEGWHGHGRP